MQELNRSVTICRYQYGNWSAGDVAGAPSADVRMSDIHAPRVSSPTVAASFVTQRSYSVGEEFRISYGGKWTNADTLLYYGFVVPDRTSIASSLILAPLFPELPTKSLNPLNMGARNSLSPQARLAAAQGCGGLSGVELRLLPDGTFHKQYTRCLRIRLLPDEEAEALLPTFGRSGSGEPGSVAALPESMALSLENEWALTRTLLQFARESLLSITSTAEDDARILGGGVRFGSNSTLPETSGADGISSNFVLRSIAFLRASERALLERAVHCLKDNWWKLVDDSVSVHHAAQ